VSFVKSSTINTILRPRLYCFWLAVTGATRPFSADLTATYATVAASLSFAENFTAVRANGFSTFFHYSI